jgi:hypothetical protein
MMNGGENCGLGGQSALKCKISKPKFGCFESKAVVSVVELAENQ